MTTTTARDAIKTLTEELEQAQLNYTERAKELFRPALAEFFDAHPGINELSWTQYTPYFMDGDECVFSVNSEVSLNEQDEYDHPNSQESIGYRDPADGVYKSKPNPNYDPNVGAAFTEASALVASVPDDLMKAMFGDHTQVTAKRDGTIDTASYDHE